jgi:hypothetical protein
MTAALDQAPFVAVKVGCDVAVIEWPDGAIVLGPRRSYESPRTRV